MAIAHVCPRCGQDLARQRPQREPHYGLRLIVCACGWAATRQVHPIWREWRRFVRLWTAVLVILTQALAIAALLAINFGAAAWVGRLWLDGGAAMETMVDRWWLIWPLGIVPVITGAWLRATFGHWRYCTQWLVWAAMVIGIMTIVFLIVPWYQERAFYRNMGPMPYETLRELAPLWRRAVVVFGAMMLVSLLAAPIGWGITKLHARRRRLRWQRRRRRWRARGQSA